MEEKLKITKYVHDRVEEYQLDSKTPWLNEIVMELEDQKYPSKKSSITAHLTLVRKKSFTLKDHFIVEGDISVKYLTTCVRCLSSFHQDINITFNSCFIDKHLSERPEYQDVSEIFSNNKCMELYFYEKKEINLKEIIHEHIFLNIDQRPIHDIDCKGLCARCGFNLNLGKCIHHRGKQNIKINLPNTQN